MSTIDQLAPAVSVSDTDLIPLSQNGTTRRSTRAQLLAGVQPQLALPSQTLLGRASPNTGAPQLISVGANLTLAAGTLSAAAAPFEIGGLRRASPPVPADLVPLGQAGTNAAASYADFMAGIAHVANLPASNMVAQAAGTSITRGLADILGDTVAAEAFGAVGDGQTDDTAALAAALASGQPVRLGPKTYIVNGQWTLFGDAGVLFGVPGQTVLRRLTQTGNGAWISIQCAAFRAYGVIFDANRSEVSRDSWALLVTPSCIDSRFDHCVFTGSGGATLGSGLTIQSSDPAVVQHVISSCEACNNVCHGIWIQAVQGVQIVACQAHDNGGYGIVIDYTDPKLIQKLHLCQVVGCECWGNDRGISIGNFNATNTEPPIWGNANPDAIAIMVACNSCHDNRTYGIAASGRALTVQHNLLTNNASSSGGAAILANVSYSMIAGNMITGSSQFGIDAGGSINSGVTQNYINGVVHGINPGGSLNMRVSGNWIQECTGWAILVNNVETDGSGINFGLACSDMAITDNWICFGMANGGGGVLLLDGPQNVLVARNEFVGIGAATIYQCLWANTDAVTIRDNSWNFQARMITNPESVGGVQQLAFADVLDGVMITAVSAAVQSMVTLRQQATAGQVTFIKVAAGGSGYSYASIAITGSGSGASATAFVSNGAVIGVAVNTPGSGYDVDGTDTAVVISGDGSGATATAFVGLPLPEERRLRVRCNCAVTFARLGSSPFQENWTLEDMTVPANADVEWTGTWGTWRAASVPLADYLQFVGDGSLIVRTLNAGDIALRPSGSGTVRITSDAEPMGMTSSIGRGSPAGVVSASPGSDYRNLDGGAGSTFWIKQSGTDASGWIAIA
ncbi:MAG: right-handed parallel beta-helix repeat-containing protein [Alphaproteobacteria bacterium]|nr:right-handed parallel beta-helix repeat-containing protein [Alphaproteobacteria bacterium]